MTDELIKIGMKYGPITLVAIYLIYFLTNTMAEGMLRQAAILGEIKDGQEQQTRILAEMNEEIKQQGYNMTHTVSYKK